MRKANKLNFENNIKLVRKLRYEVKEQMYKIILKSYLEGSKVEYDAVFNSNGSSEINPSAKSTLIFEREFRYSPSVDFAVSCSPGESSGSVSQPSWFFDNIIEPFSKVRNPEFISI